MTHKVHLFILFSALLVFGAAAKYMPLKFDYSYNASNIEYLKSGAGFFFNIIAIAASADWNTKEDILNNYVIFNIAGNEIKINTINGDVIGLPSLKKIVLFVKPGKLFVPRSFIHALNSDLHIFIFATNDAVYLLSRKPNILSYDYIRNDSSVLLNIKFSENIRYTVKKENSSLVFIFENGVLSPTLSNFSNNLFSIPFVQSQNDLRLTVNKLFSGELKKIDYLPGIISIKYSFKKGINIIHTSLKRYRIVIDPGHGGKDPGAIGYKGLKEKDVVLDVAGKLVRRLKKEMNADVIMTRYGDYFIPLSKRTEIANRFRADLFLSIHCNAAPSYKANTASGFEVYFESETNDTYSIDVAARENHDLDAIHNSRENKHMSTLDKLLTFNFAYKQHIFLSSRLAMAIKDSFLNKGVAGRGVKNAMFYVLRGTEMPAVLCEMGFVTNPKEATKLRNNAYRQKLADSLFEGIKKYFNDYATASDNKRSK